MPSTSARMRSNVAAEAVSVEVPSKPAKVARAKKAAAPTKPPATKAATTRKRPAPTPPPEPPPAPPPPAPARADRRRLVLPIARVFAVLAVSGAAIFVLVAGDGRSSEADAGAPVLVSAEELALLDRTVYWAGSIGSRKLELATTSEGTFVRYLPPGASPGDARSALTVATYPLASAYATATRRAKAAGMRSSRAEDGAIAVWSRRQPTSVYVATRGVPYLVEVYAPTPTEARSLALSGRVQPAR